METITTFLVYGSLFGMIACAILYQSLPAICRTRISTMKLLSIFLLTCVVPGSMASAAAVISLAMVNIDALRAVSALAMACACLYLAYRGFLRVVNLRPRFSGR
jgi:hypothetical protein